MRFRRRRRMRGFRRRGRVGRRRRRVRPLRIGWRFG